MGKDHLLPFVVGQKAEAMSFETGFRSAWFRCEIKEVSWTHGQMAVVLQYFDFPDERPEKIMIYQEPPYGRKAKGRKKILMLRPEYPPVCLEDGIPDVNTLSDIVVVVNSPWKVGDMVDWWSSDCYWSGRLTHIVNNDKAQIELILPPVGEGGSYSVSTKDLRPTLNWSPELGWAVPISENGKDSHRCARLVRPLKHAAENLRSVSGAPVAGASSFDSPGASGEKSSSESEKRIPDQPASIIHAKEIMASSKNSRDTVLENSGFGLKNYDSRKDSHSGNASAEIENAEDCLDRRLSHTEEAPAERQTAEEDLHHNNCSFKKVKSSEGIPIPCSSNPDSLEAAFIGLEELVHKVNWLKRVLKGGGLPLSKAESPQWKFVEHRGSSMRK